jgi:tetratricopeptide (TPR) repeat protein
MMPRLAGACLLFCAFCANFAHAGIATVEECAQAIAADPARAREDAAAWSRSGGGVPARICEASALESMGATATAARLLTGLAENASRPMAPDLRATLFEDAARLWLDEDRPDISRQALDRADTFAPPGPVRLKLRARVAAAEGDWSAATRALDAAIAQDLSDADAYALRAASLRHDGNLGAALASARGALEIAPDDPAGLFEAGAARAEDGDAEGAAADWTRLITLHPDDDLAPVAARNLARLREGAPAPSEPRPRPSDPDRPRARTHSR